MNPMALMKLMQMKNKFSADHPKFVAFLKMLISRPIEEGTVLEVTIIRPGEAPITANMKVNRSDLEMFEELKHLNPNQG